MIDLSQLTEEQINELELQIRKHKERSKSAGYKVTLFVRFMPENHLYDMLTTDGELGEGLFTDYLFDEIAPKIISDFNFDGYGEDVTIRSVKVATRQELEDAEYGDINILSKEQSDAIYTLMKTNLASEIQRNIFARDCINKESKKVLV